MPLTKIDSRRLDGRFPTQNVTSASEMPSRQFEYGRLGGEDGFGYTRSGVAEIGGRKATDAALQGDNNYSAACAAGFFGGKRP